MRHVRHPPERETRIPGLARDVARAARKRGARRRERGASRTPMAGRTIWVRTVQCAENCVQFSPTTLRPQTRRHVLFGSAATRFLFSICRVLRQIGAGGEECCYFAKVKTAVRFRPDESPSFSGRTSLASKEAVQARLFPGAHSLSMPIPVVKSADTSSVPLGAWRFDSSRAMQASLDARWRATAASSVPRKFSCMIRGEDRCYFGS